MRICEKSGVLVNRKKILSAILALLVLCPIQKVHCHNKPDDFEAGFFCGVVSAMCLSILMDRISQIQKQAKEKKQAKEVTINVIVTDDAEQKKAEEKEIKEKEAKQEKAIDVKFDSVAGAIEAKEALQEMVDFIKNPEKYNKFGAKIPKGILLSGSPGNGKTLLAKAVAGEADCNFIQVSGSEFVDVFVGEGAYRIRSLFKKARDKAPCIIFIDEIDSLGPKRGGFSSHEYDQTLNQLLVEMDGFNSDKLVIVIGATNRPDMLDEALLRPGRFDRHIEIPNPDVKCREEILKVHTKNKLLDSNVDLKKIAQATTGFSGAELANLVNEAAIIASKQNKECIVMSDIEEARDKIILGSESKTIVLSDEEKKTTAYHEAGHALINLLLSDNTNPLYKITIVPRGNALGLTVSLPEKDSYSLTKDQILANIKVAMGGRVAEELVFNKITTGASNDFEQATAKAKYMVCNAGMSKLGPVIYKQNMNGTAYSQKTAEKIDEEVQNILQDCYAQAKQLLLDNRDMLDKLANALLEKETLSGNEIYELLGL